MALTQTKEEGDDCYLPPPVVIGPDEDGVRKVIEYRLEEGVVLKVTTTTRSRSKLAAKEHRSWPRFGDAANDDGATFRSRNPHPNVLSSHEVFLDRAGTGSRAARGGPVAAMLAGERDGSVVCRTCKKGYHWTSRCPYSDLYSQLEALDEQPKPACEGGRSAAYVRRRNHDNTVRVDNLSEQARDPDLLELYGAVGPVRRAHVVVDRRTGSSKGFGFVEFVRRADAEKAIRTLDRYGYDHLIIRVERPERRVG
ncbi:eukaryotic translation initiation factor 3 subunit G-like [Triticum dicoccoides]|uniref:eukaryotic translation initiation factor 3 subunit G-like n=1 Tax=Triticum dicoccoides TaxID=85692 RepID=UPI00189013F7|nr:eukaryotic translation initiation factor 3 subunit G-like [Triticum dicoccoides]XP_044455963.1 eukaryotic translation initiation factor 3 subunit G-like [Triticum aestivum]